MPQITFSIPYTDYLNINRAWRKSGNHIYLRPEAKLAKKAVGMACMVANAGKVWEKRKVHVDILFHRPDMRSDPDNFLKLILDSIKDVIGVGDNWYAPSMDWQIVLVSAGENPRFEITVTQYSKDAEEIEVDIIACPRHRWETMDGCQHCAWHESGAEPSCRDSGKPIRVVTTLKGMVDLEE